MRPTASDCLARGFASLRSNWQLVPLLWLASVVAAGIVLVGFLLPALAIGVVDAGGFSRLGDPAAWTVFGERFGEGLAAGSPAVLGGLVGTLALIALAFFLYCYLQAGLFGVLYAADRQAPPGGRNDRGLFRTFSLRDFNGWGGLYLWRFFRFVALALLAVLAVVTLLVLLVVLVTVGVQRWGRAAGVGIGCGGSLPMIFLVLVLALWYNLAQADLVRPGSGALKASRRGADVLGRRLGAVLLVFLFFAVAGAGIGLAFAIVGWGLALARAGEVAGLAVNLVQSFFSVALSVWMAGALVALVRGEEGGR